jgi:G3E family GTPase
VDRPVVTIHVLTGFLGSGKTTLLRRLLEAGAIRKTALVVNEFASLPIDQLLVPIAESMIEVVAGGCVCCGVRGNLGEAVRNLLDQRDAQLVPWFVEIVVETTGLADPASVVAALAGDRSLEWRCRIGSVITVVDTLNLHETLRDRPELAAQVASADVMVLSKTDMSDSASAHDVLRAINPIAELVDPVRLGAPALARAWKRWTGVTATNVVALSDRTQSEHAPHRGITATVLSRAEPISWPWFATWLALLIERHGKHLLRIKGYLVLSDMAHSAPVLIQTVRHLVYPPEHLPAITSVGPGSHLAIIAEGLDTVRLQSSFEAFMSMED